MRFTRHRAIACLSAFTLAAALLPAQAPFSSIHETPSKKPASVTYLFPEQVNITANQPSPVELHFKVADGLHVNSHTPRTEDLIPTTLQLPASSGVRLAEAAYPPGKDFSFPVDPSGKLSVYTGEFIIHASFVAAPGNHLVEATLRYQACDNQVCMPPRSIPVTIDFTAR